MSEDLTGEVELFDNESSDELSDSETVTEDQSTESKDEQSDSVELKEPKKPTAEEQRLKQIDVWTQRVADGEVALDDLPPNLKWLKKSISKNLEAMNKQPEIADLVAKEIAKKEDEREFTVLKKSLNKMSLTAAQKKELQVEFSDLALHLPKSKALAKALKMVGAKVEEIDQVKKQNAALPKPGSFSPEDVPNIQPGDEGWDNLTTDQRVTVLEKIRHKGTNMNG